MLEQPAELMPGAVDVGLHGPEGQVERLKEIFGMLDENAAPKPCKGWRD